MKSLGEALWAELRDDALDVLTLCPGATESKGLLKSGLDPATMPNVMKAPHVTARALYHIADGPTCGSSDHYRALFDRLLAMPRRDGLAAMAAGVQAAGRR